MLDIVYIDASLHVLINTAEILNDLFKLLRNLNIRLGLYRNLFEKPFFKPIYFLSINPMLKLHPTLRSFAGFTSLEKANILEIGWELNIKIQNWPITTRYFNDFKCDILNGAFIKYKNLIVY